MSKVKSRSRQVISVPHNVGELGVWVGRAGDLQRELDATKLRFDRRLAKLKDAYTASIETASDELKVTVDGIASFSEAHRMDLTQNDTVKTVDVGTGVISWRVAPPRVVLRNVEGVLSTLLRKGLSQFIRVTREVNREAILADPEAAELVPGVSVEQSEFFTVKPASLGREIEVKSQRLRRAVA